MILKFDDAFWGLLFLLHFAEGYKVLLTATRATTRLPCDEPGSRPCRARVTRTPRQVLFRWYRAKNTYVRAQRLRITRTYRCASAVISILCPRGRRRSTRRTTFPGSQTTSGETDYEYSENPGASIKPTEAPATLGKIPGTPAIPSTPAIPVTAPPPAVTTPVPTTKVTVTTPEPPTTTVASIATVATTGATETFTIKLGGITFALGGIPAMPGKTTAAEAATTAETATTEAAGATAAAAVTTVKAAGDGEKSDAPGDYGAEVPDVGV